MIIYDYKENYKYLYFKKIFKYIINSRINSIKKIQ